MYKCTYMGIVVSIRTGCALQPYRLSSPTAMDHPGCGAFLYPFGNRINKSLTIKKRIYGKIV